MKKRGRKGRGGGREKWTVRGQEGEREGGREGGRERGREGKREGEREGGSAWGQEVREGENKAERLGTWSLMRFD